MESAMMEKHLKRVLSSHRSTYTGASFIKMTIDIRLIKDADQNKLTYTPLMYELQN